MKLLSLRARFVLVGLFCILSLVLPRASFGFCNLGICGDGFVDPVEECDDGNTLPGDGCAPDCTESFDMSRETPILTYTADEGYPRAMAKADLNNDGIEDFVVTTFRPSYLFSYLLSAEGSLRLVDTHQLGENTRDVKAGHLNGDHFIDVVTTDLDTDEMRVFFGNGDGTFRLANIFTPGDRLWLLDIADIDNDGFDDLIVASMYTDGFKIYYGDGQGNFPREDFIYTGGDPFSPRVVDLNNDGYNDLILSVNYAPLTQTWLGGPAGLVQSQVFGYHSANTGVIDLNNDGYMDLVSYGDVDTQQGSGKGMHLLINQKDGTFVETEQVYSGVPGWVMGIEDFNNDGNDDIAISTRANYVRVFRGDGQGGFLPEIQYPTPSENDGVIVIDLNLDGLPDFLVSAYYNDNHREIWPVINHNYYQFPRCGDGRIGRGETCDDGNTVDGDGCSSACRLEESDDTDGDGLTDAEEVSVYLTDPYDPDTDRDCVFDGDEVCSGKDPLNPADQDECQFLVTPHGMSHVLVTILRAPDYQCEVDLASPRPETLFKHCLKFVGKVAQTPVQEGDPLVFTVLAGGSEFSSDSSRARITMLNAYKYLVGFELDPLGAVDWSYDDLVLLVKFLPQNPAVGIHRNDFDEFQAVESGDTVTTLPFDGFAQVEVPEDGISGEAAVILTAGLPELYGGTIETPEGMFIGKYYKVLLTNGQEELMGSSPAVLRIAYPDEDNDGIVDGTSVDELALALKRFDEETGEWVALPTEVNPENNILIAHTGHFSLFGLAEHKPKIYNDHQSRGLFCAAIPGGGFLVWLEALFLLLPGIGLKLFLMLKGRKS